MEGCLPRDALFQLQNMFKSPDEGADSDSDIDEQVIVYRNCSCILCTQTGVYNTHPYHVTINN